MNYRARARELDAFLRENILKLSCFGTESEEHGGKVATAIGISSDWDDDIVSQKTILVRAAGQAVLEIRQAVLEGGGDPNTGFSLGRVRYIPEDDPVQLDYEGPEFGDLRYSARIYWDGGRLDVDKLQKFSRLVNGRAPERRDALIRRYLDELEDTD